MFTADFSWSEPGRETVGERRERKARERSSTANSVKTSTTTGSRTSATSERQQWWTSGLKKARCIKPNLLRPSSHRSNSSQITVTTPGKKGEVQQADELKDPTLQPSWTYATKLSPTLPSGNSFDLQTQEVPELEGDSSSRRTDSTEPRHSSERRWEMNSPPRIVILEEENDQSPRSVVTGQTRATSMATDHDVFIPTQLPKTLRDETKHSLPTHIEGRLSFEALKIHDAMQNAEEKGDVRHSMIDNARNKDRIPLSQWQCLTPLRGPQDLHLSAKPVPKKIPLPPTGNVEVGRFQRFIRRLECAGPRFILDRLTEDWTEGHGEGLDEELALEKQLWLLTGFQIQNLGKDRAAPKPLCDTGRTLELYGNLSEVFQVSAMYPQNTVHFLTTKPQRKTVLPSNVSYLTVRELGAIPLPYPEKFFSLIRASTLPSQVASSQIPGLFRECYKLLSPGGLLELRIMDAAPVRKTAGPLLRMWIEDRLSTNLERLFRCSKPCSLVPEWLTDAGFELALDEGDSGLLLPCAVDESSSSVDQELSMVIGQALWKDIWGPFVDEADHEPKWWWDNEAIMQECLKHQTMLECRAIYAYKKH